MLNRVIVSVLLSVIVMLMSGCNKKSESAHTTSKTVAVTIYSGYTMPTFLEEPLDGFDVGKLADLKKRKWYAGFNVYEESQPKTTFTLSSCEEYLPYSKQRLWTVVEKENTPFMELAVMCQATQAMLASKMADKSYLQDIKFDQTLPGKLPANLAMVLSQTERQKISTDKTIKHWQDVNKITKVEELGTHHAKYVDEGGMQELELVARGDFNGDGIEDMLLTSRDSVEGGSHSAVRLFMITRKSDTAEVELLDLKEHVN